MSPETVNLLMSDRLVELLLEKGVEPHQYLPAYNGESACLDLYSCLERPIAVHPSESVLIDTGIRIALPRGCVGLLRERGSITKTPLTLRAGVIDPGYTGTIFVACYNWKSPGHTPFAINPGDKLPFQLLCINSVLGFNQVDETEFLTYVKSSNRLEGKIGSSD